MKKDENTHFENRKIIPFQTQEVLLDEVLQDEFLEKSIIEDADRLEAELNSDPKLIGVGASEDAFSSIVERLKKDGIWEEDAMDSDSSSKEAVVPVYDKLSEKDRKSLELGRKIEERRQRRNRVMHRILKRSSAVAAMLVVILGLTMTSEANRRLVLQAWDTVMTGLGFKATTNVSGEQSNIRSKSEKEERAFRELKEKWGITPIDFGYLPEGMEYLDYEVVDEQPEIIIYYEYNDTIFSVTIISTENEASSYYKSDDALQLVKQLSIISDIDVLIYKSIINSYETAYIAEMEYRGCRYVLNGIMELSEFEKTINFSFFL